jgi:hypothetical protein
LTGSYRLYQFYKLAVLQPRAKPQIGKHSWFVHQENIYVVCLTKLSCTVRSAPLWTARGTQQTAELCQGDHTFCQLADNIKRVDSGCKHAISVTSGANTSFMRSDCAAAAKQVPLWTLQHTPACVRACLAAKKSFSAQ